MAAPGAMGDRGPTITILISVLSVFSLGTSAVRIYARWRNRQFGYDDACIAACFGPLVAGWVIAQLQVSAGFGKHMSLLSDSQIQDVLRFGFASQVITTSTLILPKTSIFFYIIRIKDSRGMRVFLIPLGVLLWLTNLAVFVVQLAECSPISAYWTRQGTCWSPDVYRTTIFVSIGYSIFSDIVCTALPTIVLWDVPLNRRLKLAICGLIGIGLVATAAAIVRAFYTAYHITTVDVSYDLASMTIWSIVEVQFAVIGANVAVARYIYGFFRDGPRAGRSRRGAAHPTFEEYDAWETESQRLFRLNSVPFNFHKKGRNEFITMPDTLDLQPAVGYEPGEDDDDEGPSCRLKRSFMSSGKTSISAG